ncbi:MAG TPA: GAF domain-containing protein [Aggregatilineales bacterium]|nr:GAF domain-containing protein [Aggregatilineales bacterium]
MTEATRRTGSELDQALTSARQTMTLLRSQAQSGRMDLAFLEKRLGAIEVLMGELSEDRKAIGQQERYGKLYEVSRVIGSSLDLQTVLDQVMDAIIQLTGAERGFLMLLDDDGNLNVRVARNFDQATIDSGGFALSRTVTRRVLETGQAIVTTNAQEDPRFAGQQSVVANALRSIMASPLRVRGEVIGVTYVDNRVRTGLFSEQDLDVLDAFAGQAAVAIDNARLFSATDEALSARVEELRMLQRVDRQLNETLDSAKAMAITLEWTSRVCNAQSATMSLLDPDQNILRVVSHYGGTDATSTGETLAPSHPLVSRVLQTRETSVGQLDGDAPMLVVPVRREGKVIGIITMTGTSETAFTEDNVALVTRMADRAAIAIENARLYDAVQAANNAKSEFVSLVAHELKVPMTSIQGYADILPKAGPVTEQQQQFVGIIKNNVNRMKVLVSDLSDISRIESGQLRVNMASVNLSDAIKTALEGTMTEIENRQHKLVVNVEPNLPPVQADPDRIAQVLLNLVSNAYKYSPNSSTITVKATRSNDRVLVSVADTGVGMTPEQLAKLGTKFWRADNGLQQQGTGLGFAITRNLIELMNASLDIESVPGKGSKFTIGLAIAH